MGCRNSADLTCKYGGAKVSTGVLMYGKRVEPGKL